LANKPKKPMNKQKQTRGELEKKLAKVDPKNRVLLISHCLRPSDLCEAKMSKKGLQCKDDCPHRCIIGRLRILAQKLGYSGVCIAPGGSMALKFIQEKKPEAVVAIACRKELEEGLGAVKEIAGKKALSKMPLVVPVPLTRDGCVDTQVDQQLAEKTVKR